MPGRRPCPGDPPHPAGLVTHRDVVLPARATLQGSAAMSFVGLLAKTMGARRGGAVAVARYLGPGGLGLFALLLG